MYVVQPVQLRPIQGSVKKPAACALAALTGKPSHVCEAALREVQDPRSRRGTPASAIQPAALRLGLGLRHYTFPDGFQLSDVPTGDGLRYGTEPIYGIVETGGGPSRKPHFAAFERSGPMFFADALNPEPVRFDRRADNPGRNGDGRRVRNIWINHDLVQARLIAEYRDHPNWPFPLMEVWHWVQTASTRQHVDRQDWTTIAQVLEMALDSGGKVRVPALNDKDSDGSAGWLWSAREVGRTGLVGHMFHPDSGQVTAVFAAGLGQCGIKAYRELQREVRGSRSAQGWPILDRPQPPNGRWCYGRDLPRMDWLPDANRFKLANLNPPGSREESGMELRSWAWFEALVAWAWFGLYSLDCHDGQVRPPGDDWVPPRRTVATRDAW